MMRVLILMLSLVLSCIGSYMEDIEEKRALYEETYCPLDKMFMNNLEKKIDCVQCIGKERKQKTSICRAKAGFSSVLECFDYKEWPQCSFGDYCNPITSKCENINSNMLNGDALNQCPENLKWSHQLKRCVQCLHSQRIIDISGRDNGNIECHDGISYTERGLPSNVKVGKSPKSVFMILIVVLLVIVLLSNAAIQLIKLKNEHSIVNSSIQ